MSEDLWNLVKEMRREQTQCDRQSLLMYSQGVYAEISAGTATLCRRDQVDRAIAVLREGGTVYLTEGGKVVSQMTEVEVDGELRAVETDVPE